MLAGAALESSEERERSVRTGRGWWVVWARQQGRRRDDDEVEGDSEQKDVVGNREILVVRRARDSDGKKGRSAWGIGGDGKETKMDASRMGIGFDPRKYMEGIVRMGR